MTAGTDGEAAERETFDQAFWDELYTAGPRAHDPAAGGHPPDTGGAHDSAHGDAADSAHGATRNEAHGDAHGDVPPRPVDRLWSGLPNATLVVEVTDLAPGTALDVGCGEGADAVWLAGRGWTVTGVDLSVVALDRARASVADDPDVASRLTWEHRDLTAWEPPASAFDLVSAQYVHLPADQLTALLAGLGRAVAPGGTLLVVGHDPTDTHAHRAPQLQSAAQLAARLDAREWEILVSEARPRTTDGRIDAVLRARRRTSG